MRVSKERTVVIELEKLFSKYTENKKVTTTLIENFKSLYKELELPMRFKNESSEYEEVLNIKSLIKILAPNQTTAKEIDLKINRLIKNTLINQYELKIINIIREELKLVSNTKPNVEAIVENLSTILDELSKNKKIQEIDRERAKNYDSSKYQAFSKIN